MIAPRQKSEDWHSWRRAGVCSSDAAAIMTGRHYGKSDFEVFYEKVAPLSSASERRLFYAISRGERLEQKARESYQLLSGRVVRPALSVRDDKPWIRASLDGIDLDRSTILEVKNPISKADHLLACEGKLPPQHIPQIQHQLLATPEAEAVDFFSFDGSHGGAIVRVYRDKDYLYRLEIREACFWRRVQDGIWRNMPEPGREIFDNALER